MSLIKWDEETRAAIQAKYPGLEGKKEGIVFCAAALDEDETLKLGDIKDWAGRLGVNLGFSGASIGSAKVAMGLEKRRPRKQRQSRENADAQILSRASSRIAKIERKLGAALDLIERYEEAHNALEAAREALKRLSPSLLSLLGDLDQDAFRILQREGLLVREFKEEGEG